MSFSAGDPYKNFNVNFPMKQETGNEKGVRKWQLHEVIYESETTAGKVFDITLPAFFSKHHRRNAR
jgi:hypothetical protein